MINLPFDMRCWMGGFLLEFTAHLFTGYAYPWDSWHYSSALRMLEVMRNHANSRPSMDGIKLIWWSDG